MFVYLIHLIISNKLIIIINKGQNKDIFAKFWANIRFVEYGFSKQKRIPFLFLGIFFLLVTFISWVWW